MQDLGTLGGLESEALGVSADGAVVVGVAEDRYGRPRAFRWTAEQGMQDLGTLGGNWSKAMAVSPKGTVVVGVAQDSRGRKRAFRWTAEQGMQDLGTLGGLESEAMRVSAEETIVGLAQDQKGVWQTFYWTPESGLHKLSHGHSAFARPGVALWGVPAISLNGQYLVGTIYHRAHHRVAVFLLDAPKLNLAIREDRDRP